MPAHGLAFLGMPDIETLGVLTINYETIGRQLTPDDNPDNKQKNYQCERTIQTEGGKLESYAYNRQDVDTQKQCNAYSTADTTESCTNRRQHDEAQEKYIADNVDASLLILAQQSQETSTIGITAYLQI